MTFREIQCLRSAAPTRVLGDRLQQGNQGIVVVPQALASARARSTRRRPPLAPIARRPAAAAPRLWVRRCLPLCPKHSRSLPRCANVRQAGNNAAAADRGPIHLRRSPFHTLRRPLVETPLLARRSPSSWGFVRGSQEKNWNKRNFDSGKGRSTNFVALRGTKRCFLLIFERTVSCGKTAPENPVWLVCISVVN